MDGGVTCGVGATSISSVSDPVGEKVDALEVERSSPGRVEADVLALKDCMKVSASWLVTTPTSRCESGSTWTASM